MKLVVALGGNALLRRGEQMTIENQRANVAVACEHLAGVATQHELVISHGNGPQIGLLALEGAAYEEVPAYPLDVLGAETQGMLGYLIQQEMRNQLSPDTPIASLLTMIEVDPKDPAFKEPTKPIGPQYSTEAADQLKRERGWSFRADGDFMRRVVPSPAPKHIVEHAQIASLLRESCIVICAGGGGIPVARNSDGQFYGVEAVVDKDLASSLLARDLVAALLVMATDTPNAYLDFGTPNQRAIVSANPDAVLNEYASHFAKGSMLPKITAACEFAQLTGHSAVIGQLGDIEQLVAGTAGTRISTDVSGVTTAPA